MEVKLRAWRESDIPALVKYANNWKIAGNMTDQFPYPYGEENAKLFIGFATGSLPIHLFAIDHADEAIGGMGVHPQTDIMRKNAELGYWLAEPFWGNGIISSLIPQMIDIAFKTYDITRLYARPFGTNLASQRVLEKNGFKLEARIEKNIFKNGEYLDELIYAVRKQ